VGPVKSGVARFASSLRDSCTPLVLIFTLNMQMHSQNEITRLLTAWTDGDQSALEKLVPLVESELHRLAHHYMGRERPGHTLQTSALVNEAYIRLIDWKNVRWQNRAHFFAVSAQLMRRILVDFARQRNYLKRGGGALLVSLTEAESLPLERNDDLVALDEALAALSQFDERKARVVELRFFGGLSVKEVAEVLNVSEETVMRDWRLAKVWLLRELGQESTGES
jgi:RNA polymerase sigma-70 factor (ECF subfamily)